jgi:hypothetical protein
MRVSRNVGSPSPTRMSRSGTKAGLLDVLDKQLGPASHGAILWSWLCFWRRLAHHQRRDRRPLPLNDAGSGRLGPLVER